MNVTIEKYYSGTSGIVLPVPNKTYYPNEFQNKSRLSYYASLMNSIEINSSFYKIPLSATIKKWTNDVPEEFLFTFKLFREVTHTKNLNFCPETVKKFFSVVSNVGNKKGCILVQFPPSVRVKQIPQLSLLMETLQKLNRDNEWMIALEFRHSSLYCNEIYRLLKIFQVELVIHDKHPAISPIRDSHSDFVYLRFHGPEGNYRGSYGNDILKEYASYINKCLNGGKKVFVYFNNTMGAAYTDLNKLRKLISEI